MVIKSGTATQVKRKKIVQSAEHALNEDSIDFRTIIYRYMNIYGLDTKH